jgi:hypothetical protein
LGVEISSSSIVLGSLLVVFQLEVGVAEIEILAGKLIPGYLGGAARKYENQKGNA